MQPGCLAKILRNPQLNLGATYVSGVWRPAAGSDLHGVLKLLRLNFEQPLAPGKLSLTLAEWHRRFTAQRVYFAAESGEHFCRTWEFYLAICKTAVEVGGLTVHHWQLQRPGGVLPSPEITYISDSGSEAVESSAKPIKTPMTGW